jgi:putative ABC transport system permease protein
MFAYEGAVYALIASGVGSVLGVGLGWVMVEAIGAAFGRFGGPGEFNVAFAFEPKSVAIAFLMGMVLTFLIVLVASWRVSRLNIVRAIRDIAEPEGKRSLKGWLLAGATPAVGIFALWRGLGAENLALYMLGTSFVIVGVALVARRLWVPDRAAFTAAGIGLLSCGCCLPPSSRGSRRTGCRRAWRCSLSPGS